MTGWQSSHQLRSRLVNGTQFGAIGIQANGNFAFGCETFSDQIGTIEVNGSLECSDTVAMLMQGL